jgi:hypothetical protein
VVSGEWLSLYGVVQRRNVLSFPDRLNLTDRGKLTFPAEPDRPFILLSKGDSSFQAEQSYPGSGVLASGTSMVTAPRTWPSRTDPAPLLSSKERRSRYKEITPEK